MAAVWPPKVLDAIAEAVARGDRHSVARTRLLAGTLPGLDEPVDMPARTFTYHWTAAKKAQQRSRDEGPQQGEPVLEQLRRAIAERDERDKLAATQLQQLGRGIQRRDAVLDAEGTTNEEKIEKLVELGYTREIAARLVGDDTAREILSSAAATATIGDQER